MAKTPNNNEEEKMSELPVVENIEPQQQNNTHIGGKKKIGRPKKIKSAAKVKLGHLI